jgi:hypothetical protein
MQTQFKHPAYCTNDPNPPFQQDEHASHSIVNLPTRTQHKPLNNSTAVLNQDPLEATYLGATYLGTLYGAHDAHAYPQNWTATLYQPSAPAAAACHTGYCKL